LILTSSLMRTARRARSSSSLGNSTAYASLFGLILFFLENVPFPFHLIQFC
jgi:hypothetical protein